MEKEKFGEFRGDRRLSQYELDNLNEFMQDSNNDIPSNNISLKSTVQEFFNDLKPADDNSEDT
jgi:hypothetical protein